MVYVVLGFRVSFSSISIAFPVVFISGCSSCGGQNMMFSVAFSTFMYSLNRISSFCWFTFVALSPGVAPITLGGTSSYHPPSGCPIRAHDATSTDIMYVHAITRRVLPIAVSAVLLVVFLPECFCILSCCLLIISIECSIFHVVISAASHAVVCYLFIFSSWSMCSRVFERRGTLCCPPSLPRCFSHVWNSPGRATTISSGCSVMSLYRFAS